MYNAGSLLSWASLQGVARSQSPEPLAETRLRWAFRAWEAAGEEASVALVLVSMAVDRFLWLSSPATLAERRSLSLTLSL